MKQFRPILVVLLVALGAQLTPAEAAAQQRRGMGGGAPEAASLFRVYGFAGWAAVELDDLNARLTSLPEPYSEVGEDLVLLGGGLHARLDRLMVGAEGAASFSLEEAEVTDVRRASFTGYHAALMLGFSVIQTSGLDIYPLVQVGGAGGALEVQERGAPAWDDVLADPGQSTILTTATFYGAGGIGMDYAFRNGFFMGLRGTYAYTPVSDDWSSETDDVLGGPEIDLSGPSVRLMVGFGGRGGSR